MSKFKSTRFIVTLLLTVSLVLTLTNQVSPANGVRFRVRLKVVSDNYASKIQSYMSQALRALGDVAIDHDNPDYTIYISNFDAGPLTHAFGVTILSRIPESRLSPNLTEFEKQWYREDAGLFNESYVTMSSGPMTVKDRCENIIAEFDGSILEDTRYIARKMDEYKQSPLPTGRTAN